MKRSPVIFRLRLMALHIVVLAAGLVLSPSGLHAPTGQPPRAHVLLCEGADALAAEARVQAAAARVVKVAEQFGSAQAVAASAWVGEAMRTSEGDEVEPLLAKQLTLFEECTAARTSIHGGCPPC